MTNQKTDFGKKDIFLLEVLPPLFIFGVFFCLFAFNILEFAPIKTECFLSHTGTVNVLNENNKVTYDNPKEICDIKLYKNKHGLIGYQYSYTLQTDFDKDWSIVKPSCDDVHFDDTATFDKDTMSFICHDGTIAREYRSFD